MVQYTNLLVASAVAAVIPAMAAPFGGRHVVESRELNNVEAREPMFKAMIDAAAHGPARRVITAPLRKTAQDALDQHPNHYGPGPAQLAMSRILQEQKERQQPRPRDLEAFEEFDAREPMFKAMIDVAAHGPARRVITAPLRKTAEDALDQHPHHYGPGPAQLAMSRILQEQKERQQPRPRDLEAFQEFDAREPMFKAIIDAAAHAPARRVITEPLKKTAHDAFDQHQQPSHHGPGPAQQAMNRILQEQKERQQQRPRDLENLLEREFFDLD